MSVIHTIEENFSAQGCKVCMVQQLYRRPARSRRNRRLGASWRGARANIYIVKAPGAYELPLVVQRVAASKKYDAIIVVGAVIRSGAVRRISNTSPGNASKVSAVFR